MPSEPLPHPPSGRHRVPWAALAVYLVLAAGLVAVWQRHARVGTTLIGVSFLLSAGLRLVLPTRLAGMLVVRRRLVDVLMLVVLGVVAVTLALVAPSGT